MNLSSLQKKIRNLPQNPGVYIFYGEKKSILYVGKATNLKSRVQSYFRGGEAERLIGRFMDQVADIKTVETESVLEALILESNMIKKYQPKYNAMGKDDKSFCYFAVTREEFPKIIILRATDLRDKFPISKSQFPNKSKISKSKNKKNIPNTKYKIPYTKTYGPYTSKRQMEIALKIIRKIFPFHSAKQKTEKGCLDFQIGLCPGPYAEEISRKDYQKNIRGIKMILEGKKKNLVRKLEKEMRGLADCHEYERASEVRNKIYALKHIRDVALISREDDLEIQDPKLQIPNKFKIQNSKFKILRIEAYDISNISGQHAVGSMVVFQNSEPDKAQYRKFKIKTIKGIDDVGMMQEVLYRRFNNDWPQPDLILLDGGAGHLNMGQEVLESLGLKIPVGAVAKGPTRKKLQLMSNSLQSSKEIKYVSDDKNILKRIMDEAHRFAVGYHRNLRGKDVLR